MVFVVVVVATFTKLPVLAPSLVPLEAAAVSLLFDLICCLSELVVASCYWWLDFFLARWWYCSLIKLDASRDVRSALYDYCWPWCCLLIAELFDVVLVELGYLLTASMDA